MLVWKCDMCKKAMESEDDLFEISLTKGNTTKIAERWSKVLDISSKKRFDMCQRCAGVLFSALGRKERGEKE